MEGRDLSTDPPVRIRRPQTAWFARGGAREAAVPSFKFTEVGTGDWEADSYRILAELLGQAFGLPEEWIFGADRQTRRVDLLAIDRFKG